MEKLKDFKLFSKKFIAWALVICLLLQNLPTTSIFAETTSDEHVKANITSVLENGNEKVTITVTPSNSTTVSAITLPNGDIKQGGAQGETVTAEYLAKENGTIAFEVAYEYGLSADEEVPAGVTTKSGIGTEVIAMATETFSFEATLVGTIAQSSNQRSGSGTAADPFIMYVGDTVKVSYNFGENYRYGWEIESGQSVVSQSGPTGVQSDRVKETSSTVTALNAGTAVVKLNFNRFIGWINSTSFYFEVLDMPVIATNPPTQEDAGEVKVNKTAEWTDYSNREAEITFELTGVPVEKGYDVVIVLDTSGSMKNDISTAKTAVNQLAEDLLKNKYNRVGLVLFDGDENYDHIFDFTPEMNASADTTVVQLTKTLDTITKTVNAATANGGTNYTSALRMVEGMAVASKELNRDLNVIFVTDGDAGLSGDSWNNANWNGTNEAKALKDAGATIYTVGFNGISNNGKNLLENEIASSSKHATIISEASQLAATFETILVGIQYAATNAVLTDVISEYYTLGAESDIVAPAGVTVKVGEDKKTLTFDIGNLTAETTTITIPIIAKEGLDSDEYPTNSSATLKYNDNTGAQAEKNDTNPTNNPDIQKPSLPIEQGKIDITYYLVNESGQFLSKEGAVVEKNAAMNWPVDYTVNGSSTLEFVEHTVRGADFAPQGYSLHTDNTTYPATQTKTLSAEAPQATVEFLVVETTEPVEEYYNEDVSIHILLPGIDVQDRNTNNFYNNLGAGQFLNSLFDVTALEANETGSLTNSAEETSKYLTEGKVFIDSDKENSGAPHIQNNKDWDAYDVIVQMAKDGKVDALKNLAYGDQTLVFEADDTNEEIIEKANKLQAEDKAGNAKHDFQITWLRIVKVAGGTISTGSYFQPYHIDGVIFDEYELKDVTLEFQYADKATIAIDGTENPITTKEKSDIANFKDEAEKFASEVNKNAETGKVFSHWAWGDGSTSTREDFDNTGLQFLDKNYVFYAVMKDIEYSITYYDEDTTEYDNLIPASYTVSSVDITLPTEATMEANNPGYNFLGWTATNNVDDTTYITTIPANTTGNKEFYANWEQEVVEPETYELTYKSGLTPEEEALITMPDAVNGLKENDEVTLARVERAGYVLKAWSYGSDTYAIDYVNYTDTIFTMPAKNVELTAIWARDLNDNNVDDEEEYITITFLPGTNGSFANGDAQVTHTNLLPEYSTYPATPTVTELNIDNGYNLTWWYDANDAGYTADTTLVIPMNTESATYTAQYTEYSPEDPETVTVTFVADVNGTLEGTNTEEVVINGSVSEVPTAIPNTDYKFEAWYEGEELIGDNAAVEALTITEETTFTAKFYLDRNDNDVDDEDETLTIIFAEGSNGTIAGATNGEVIYEIIPGDTYPTAPGFTANTGYRTNGWNPAYDLEGTLESVGEIRELIFTAQYLIEDEDIEVVVRNYTVRFVDHDGDLLKSETVRRGNDATPPADPTREGYTFSDWDGTYTNVTSSRTITAIYTQNTVIEEEETPLNPTPESYTVTFVRPDGTVLGTDTVIEGQDATAPTNTALAGFVFNGWDTVFTNVQEDLTVTAIYVQVPVIAEIEEPEVPLAPGPVLPDEEDEEEEVVETFTVRFLDHDGDVLSEQEVVAGTGAEAPVDPERDGYNFTGWSEDFAAVTGDMDIVAQYAEVVEIEDGETPLGNNTIDDEATPLGTIELDDNGNAWSLFDLIATILTTLSVLVYMMNRKKKEDEETASTQKNKKYGVIIGGLLAVVSIVLLILTQDFTAPMAMFDKFSLWFALIVVVQVAQMLVLGRKKEDEESMNA